MRAGITLCECVSVLTVEMLLGTDLSSFNEVLFISNMATELEVDTYQVVTLSKQAGSTYITFEVQPISTDEYWDRKKVDAMVEKLQSGTMDIDISHGGYEVLAIAMPYEKPEDDDIDLVLIVCIAVGAFAVMATIVVGGILCIRSRTARKIQQAKEAKMLQQETGERLLADQPFAGEVAVVPSIFQQPDDQEAAKVAPAPPLMLENGASGSGGQATLAT